jgi:Tfp pilus assembly PilM family ATPase
VLETEGSSIANWLTQPLDADALRNGDPVDPETLGAQLREALRAGGIKATRARVAIPDEAVVTRVVELPGIPKRHLAGVMRFAAEQELPFPLPRANWVWDAPRSGGMGWTVWLVGAWRDVVDRLIQVVRTAGLSLEVVEPRSLSMARALDIDQVLILDAEGRSVQLTGLLGRRPPFTERMTLNLDRTDWREAVDRLLKLAIAHQAENRRPSGLTPVMVAGDLESSDLQLARPVVPVSLAMNGNPPERPPTFPSGKFLGPLGLARR